MALFCFMGGKAFGCWRKSGKSSLLLYSKIMMLHSSYILCAWAFMLNILYIPTFCMVCIRSLSNSSTLNHTCFKPIFVALSIRRVPSTDIWYVLNERVWNLNSSHQRKCWVWKCHCVCIPHCYLVSAVDELLDVWTWLIRLHMMMVVVA